MCPQTNGMVERFNGRVEDVLQSHRVQSAEELDQAILRHVHLYNSQLPQAVLKGLTPINALKDWQKHRPELFRTRPYNHAGCGKKPVPGDAFARVRQFSELEGSAVGADHDRLRCDDFMGDAAQFALAHEVQERTIDLWISTGVEGQVPQGFAASVR